MSAEQVDFQLLFDSLPSPHLVLQPEGLTLVAYNDSMRVLLGGVGPEVLGQPITQVLDAGPAAFLHHPEWEQAVQEVVEQRKVRVLETQPALPGTDNGLAGRFWQLTLRPVAAPDGSLRYVLCRCLDVTEQRRAEQQERISHEGFTLLARATHDAIWDYDMRTGRIWRNELFTTLFGYPVTPENSTIDFWRSCLHPDDQPALENYLQILLTGTDTAATGEYRMRRADGSWAEVVDRFYIMRDAQGQPYRMLGAMQDVTQNHRTKRDLRQSLARFQVLANFIPQLVWAVNQTGQATYFNQRWQEYTGIDFTTPPPNFTWTHLLHPDDQVGATQGWQQALATGNDYEAEFRIRDQHGQYRWFLAQACPVRGTDGHIEQWFCTCTNIDDQKRTQLVLEEKDRQLQYIMGEVPAYIATLLGPEHVIGFANSNFRKLLGKQFQLGQSARTAYSALARQGLLELLDQVYATGQRVAGHERPVQVLTPINGKRRTYYFDFVCQPLFNEAGTVHGILVFAVDITDRALANRRAEAMDVKMRLMTDSLPQITVVTAPNGSVEYLSRQWFDYTGQTLADRNRCWQLALTAEDQRALRALLAHAATTGQVHTQELRLRRHDGEYRWHLGRLVPALDETGSVQRWYGSITDIHEQRLLSDELRRSEEQFRFLAESVPAIVWTARPDGQFDYLNSRWSLATGVPVEDTLREGWLHLLRPEQVAYTQQLFEQSMSTGQVLDMENSLRHVPTGRYRWYLHRAQPLRDASGAIVRWFGTTTDIDDYKRIQQHLEEKNAELIRTNQDLDSFVYTASHDLKQPINNMAGIFEELTRTAYFRDPDAVKLVAMFDKCLHQIYATIHDLSELVQVQKMRRGLTAELVNLAQLTQEVLLSIEEPLNSARAIVTTDFTAVPVVEFVRPNLQSVLYNLISNALKYAAPKRRPRIHLSTRLEEGHPVLLVQDNGLGIDLERFGSQMFQLFRRFHSHVEGSGLGLYLVNRIVESHGGHIVVESKVNEGTTFQVHLLPLGAHG